MPGRLQFSGGELRRPIGKAICTTASRGQRRAEAGATCGSGTSHPHPLRLTASLSATPSGTCAHDKTVRFGMREFGTQGTQFTINGRPTFLRGTLECCIFPLTAIRRPTVPQRTRILPRGQGPWAEPSAFHSWLPPEAASTRPNREASTSVKRPSGRVGSDPAVDASNAEADRILKTYGNHPRTAFSAWANEPSGKNRDQFLTGSSTPGSEGFPASLHRTSGWPELAPINTMCG